MTNNLIDYRAVLEDLESRIKTLQAAADAIRAMVSLTDSATAIGALSVAQDSPAGMYFNMSIAEAIEKYLDGVKRPKSPADIANALEVGGFPHTSKDFVATVRSAIFREVRKPDAKIVKRPDGDYGLISWYPGLRSKQGRTGQENAEQDPEIAKMAREILSGTVNKQSAEPTAEEEES